MSERFSAEAIDMAGIVIVLLFGAIVVAWGIWDVNHTEETKRARKKQ